MRKALPSIGDGTLPPLLPPPGGNVLVTAVVYVQLWVYTSCVHLVYRAAVVVSAGAVLRGASIKTPLGLPRDFHGSTVISWGLRWGLFMVFIWCFHGTSMVLR